MIYYEKDSRQGGDPEEDSGIPARLRGKLRTLLLGTWVTEIVPDLVGLPSREADLLAASIGEVIAATVGSDPTKYNEAFLGKPNPEYCEWILNPEKWGGAIELSILSEYYGREIAAYDIQTTRCDLYGQDRKYNERVMLFYDGLHYDALAMSPSEGAPEEFDQTIFAVHDGTIGAVERLALNLVKDANRRRSYTDTAKFTLWCDVCQIGVVGQKEAVEHAQATGHVNFQEYR